MIIVDKAEKTTINIPKNSLGNLTYNKPINVDLSDYYTKEEVDELIDNVEVDLTGYATEQWVDDNYQVKGDYLTSIPDEYVTETELTAKNYATQTWVENNYATNSDVNDEIGKLDSLLTSEINQKQDTLVSGENIKTINGNSLLGSGDIVVEGGGSSIVELTQAEYDALGDNVDADTLYLISDATISANYKTINGESILGKGNIEISVPDEYVTDTELTNKGYATTTYVDTQIGNINTILENIIG